MNREFDRRVCSISPEAIKLLMKHNWPGNVRELQSAVKHAMIHTPGDILLPEALPIHLHENSAGHPHGTASGDLEVGRLTQEYLARSHGNIYYHVQAAVDRVVLNAVLEHVKGNQVEAAELLGISRNTLRSKLRNLGLVIEKQLNEAE
jgi:two-component system nitrogen regulation response regulator GlnG